MKNGIALNIGCGGDIKKELGGFPCTNLDIRSLEGVDMVIDVRDLSAFTTESVDYILASDIIEHFPLSETNLLLKEWARVLRKGGVMEIRTPSLKFWADHYVNNHDAKFASYHIFGGQDYPGNFHYVIFDGPWLTVICAAHGLSVINYREEGSNFILKVEKR